MNSLIRESWSTVLSALDLERPILYGDARADWAPDWLADLITSGLLQELPPSDCVCCTDCIESPICDVVYFESPHDRPQRPMAQCPYCGLFDVAPDALRRWSVDCSTLMDRIAQSLDLVAPRSEIVPGRLWRLGRAFGSGTQWSVWLGLQLNGEDAADVLGRAQLPQRTLLLVPGRLPEDPLPAGVAGCRLGDATVWMGNALQWDNGRLNELLGVSDEQSHLAKRTHRPKRQIRASDVASIVTELKQHLRAARDHAEHTASAGDGPALLPRPTQRELARRLGVSESRVSRSLNDPQAAELRLLWNLADDLPGVLRFVS